MTKNVIIGYYLPHKHIFSTFLQKERFAPETREDRETTGRTGVFAKKLHVHLSTDAKYGGFPVWYRHQGIIRIRACFRGGKANRAALGGEKAR